jgi:hypothetical protein
VAAERFELLQPKNMENIENAANRSKVTGDPPTCNNGSDPEAR